MGIGQKKAPLGLAIVAALAATPSALLAQELEEIVVTAERRESSLQQTPISVAAFTAETMELKGIENIDDIATFTPNLDIKGSRGTGNSSPTYQIRGLSGGGGTGERSAAMYIDGVFMPRTTGPFMSVLDIERIEVLRGPQGTLFGRNSTGGAIRVFTKQPGPELDGNVRLTAGNFGRGDVTAMVNVPITDTVFFRAQGGSLRQDGYVERGTQDLGGSKDTLGKLQLAFEPSDTFRLTLGLSSAKSESDGNPQDLATFDMNPDLNFQGNRADWISDFLAAAGQPRISPDNDPRIVLDDYTMPGWCFLDDADPDWDALCEQTNESDYQQFDVNLEWQINDNLTLTSITGLSDFESNGITDWVMLGSEARMDHVESDVLYQELQLNASLANGRIDLVSGISYFQEDARSGGVPSYDRRGTSAYSPAGGTANGDAVAVGSGPNGLFVTGLAVTDQDAQSIGLFTNLTWHITDRLDLTPGVRFAFDDKAVTQTRFDDDSWNPFGGAASTTVYAEDDWNDVDWRLTVDYKITDDHMVYATVSKAFRAGAYNYQISPTFSGADQTAQLALGGAFIPPESVENQEIGMRTEWLDGRLRINLTYFDMDYSDRQGPIQIVDTSSPTGFRIGLVDTGDVFLSGIELEGQIAATEQFTIDFSAGLVDPELADACANNGDFLFPGPVEESYSLGGRWSLPMRSRSNLTLSLAYGWVGSQQTHPGGTATPCFNAAGAPNVVPTWFFDSRYELPSYGLWNGRVRYTSSDGKWGLTVFGNNLTDEVYGNFATRFGGGFWDGANPAGVGAPQRSALGITRGRPRELGVTFQYNFGGGGGSATR
jgi:iron complex outermembrane receptor protein